ncbi:PilZ domain-containing protein [Altererythrobacter salegens]|uniref:PilZ domain-containing protein n=1 Tax=Croceibacterium salegens TaxID=1737568 RepID=A0A6I4T324_9SPHN|nr:PilZ domain-containing protein [Croceibacterium salegens]MXO61102.1 PilZ domain-containing protein [Croceibacterium salegens]
MSSVETRQVERDSLLLIADVRIDGGEKSHRVKVRNLSSGGMMAEAELKVARGALVTVELRNIGAVEGSIAWIEGSRFGIAFVEEIDPKLARAPVGTSGGDLASPRFTRTAIDKAEPGKLRAI